MCEFVIVPPDYNGECPTTIEWFAIRDEFNSLSNYTSLSEHNKSMIEKDLLILREFKKRAWYMRKCHVHLRISNGYYVTCASIKIACVNRGCDCRIPEYDEYDPYSYQESQYKD